MYLNYPKLVHKQAAHFASPLKVYFHMSSELFIQGCALIAPLKCIA